MAQNKNCKMSTEYINIEKPGPGSYNHQLSNAPKDLNK